MILFCLSWNHFVLINKVLVQGDVGNNFGHFHHLDPLSLLAPSPTMIGYTIHSFYLPVVPPRHHQTGHLVFLP